MFAAQPLNAAAGPQAPWHFERCGDGPPLIEDVRRQMGQRVMPLEGELAADVEAKLLLLDTILANKWVGPNETVKLQALGVALGDALAQELGLAWAAVEDEYGCDAALILKGTSIKVFPLTSISKRVEAGEPVNVRELFAAACSAIRRAANDA